MFIPHILSCKQPSHTARLPEAVVENKGALTLFKCAHSTEETISGFSKAISSSFNPARCSSCGKTSVSQPRKGDIGEGAATVSGFFVTLILCAITASIYPLYVFLLILIVVYYAKFKKSTLIPAEKEKAVNDKRWLIFPFLCIFLLVKEIWM